MNVYDFDKTIFYPDSSFCFVLFCFSRHPFAVLRTLPRIVSAGIRFASGKIDTTSLKESLFAFLRFLPDPEQDVADFWRIHFRRIGMWYLERKKQDDLIVTASPEFLVSVAAGTLGVALIGTRMDVNTGTVLGKNCSGEEKVRRFRECYPDAEIQSFFSDSLSDQPMASLAGKAYLVRKGSLKDWPAS